MALGNWPVASLRQRAVYKTEFDIFKQNTDIDLISLLSYEEHTPKHYNQQTLDDRPKTVPDFKTRPTCGNTERYSNRKRILSAYDPDRKNSRIKSHPDREFKRNTWTKRGTRIYKDFARTSKSFLKHRQKDTEPKRETRVDRDCKSALDIRRSSAVSETRSQTACGFHLNERHRSNTGNTNAQNEADVATSSKETKLNRQVNKTERSISNHIWRTKSAPTTARRNLNSRIKRNEQANNTGVLINKRCRSVNKEIKNESINETVSHYFENQDSGDKEITTDYTYSPCRTCSPGTTDLNCENSHLESEIVTVVCPDTFQSVKKRLQELENLECVENENVTYVVEGEENCNIFTGNGKETANNSVTFANEDGIGSKDSGFASYAASPELQFLHKGEFGDEKSKRVKFQIENTKTGDSFEQLEQCSVISENGNSCTLSDRENEAEENVTNTTYDINNLITDLERFGANSRLSVISTGGQSNFTADGEAESLCGYAAEKALDDLRAEEEKGKTKTIEKKEQSKLKDIETLNMSREARHAIMETLKDMGTKTGKGRNKENDLIDIRHKGVNAQRRQSDNRSKYEFYMRERTKSFFRNQFKSMDSIGNEENSSAFSSPREVKDCDDSSSDEYPRVKLFPSIRENTKLSKTTTSSNKSKKVMTLEHAKKTKYKIPGIGNYHLLASPENDFEITPPGFDSRYNPRPIISKDEMEIPPRFIRERSIEKCKTWLTNINLSPMSLRPAKKK